VACLPGNIPFTHNDFQPVFLTFGKRFLLQMAHKKKDPYSFFLVASGLLIGFFLGAAIIYFFHNRPAGYQLTDAALEQVNRLFQQQTLPPASDPAPASTLAEAPASTSDSDPDPDPASAPARHPFPAAGQNNPEPHPLPADTTGFPGADAAPVPSTANLEAPRGVSFAETDNLAFNPNPGEPDSLAIHPGPGKPDSLAINPGPAEPHSRGVLREDIRVQRDRLLGTFAFTLPEAKPPASESTSTRILDSLLGGRQGHPYRTLQVEFWESPLNFSGYKMSKNSLILYGLDQIESVSLLLHDEVLFLKYHGIYFPLALTSEFLPLTAVDDSLLINKLEQQWP
jgi:hypothetical protein